MRVKGGFVYDLQNNFVARDVFSNGPFIADESGDRRVIDAKGCYVIPGLTDIHLHGAMGADFSDGDAEGLHTIAAYELSQGVTQFCPTGMTLSEDALAAACRTALVYAQGTETGSKCVGVNLEGPFLSEAKKGGQNGAWLRTPDYAMLCRLSAASVGLVKFVTVAPELPGAMEFIAEASQDFTVSLGHTAADYDTAEKAFSAGAAHATHLFNAMPPFSHRAPGVVGSAFDSPACKVELICDGIHIHPSVVRAVFQLFGANRVILVSDSMRATGMPDGEYMLGGQMVKVRSAKATLPDGTLAGSATNLMRCMQNAIEYGISPQDAVRAAAVNPAQAAGVFDKYGSLEPGKYANFVILNSDYSVRTVVFQGKVIE